MPNIQDWIFLQGKKEATGKREGLVIRAIFVTYQDCLNFIEKSQY